jgi:hypothetical protein
MENRVSKRHKNSLANQRFGSCRNSESTVAPHASQLLPVWPKDLSDRSRPGRQKLIAIIERELRKERRLGLAGHRGYDIARHAKLVQLLRAERDAFRALGSFDAPQKLRGGATDIAPT